MPDDCPTGSEGMHRPAGLCKVLGCRQQLSPGLSMQHPCDCQVSCMQAADNMTEGLVSLVNLSRLAWRTISKDTSMHGTKGRLERARSTVLQGQDR